MKILSIETSCDETAIAILEASGDDKKAEFEVLGDAMLSQIELHRDYGGVFPTLAKREHAKNIVPMLKKALADAEMLEHTEKSLPAEKIKKLEEILSREPELLARLKEFAEKTEAPEIDAIAVTVGPGLEPALWIGVNFAEALALLWDKPIVPVNHMEGHILSSLIEEGKIENTKLPLLALLISGGHTELVLMREWLKYELVGQTLDDAVGEAFDKVARMMDLPYPGGPEISKLAEKAREQNMVDGMELPRPMLNKQNCDFSFSGLKTAVLYKLKDMELSEDKKREVAMAFEDTVTEVLLAKTRRAIKETGAKTLVIGGGVSANKNIQKVFREELAGEVDLHIPEISLTTDNAVMIAIAGFYRAQRKEFIDGNIKANGNLALF